MAYDVDKRYRESTMAYDYYSYEYEPPPSPWWKRTRPKEPPPTRRDYRRNRAPEAPYLYEEEVPYEPCWRQERLRDPPLARQTHRVNTRARHHDLRPSEPRHQQETSRMKPPIPIPTPYLNSQNMYHEPELMTSDFVGDKNSLEEEWRLLREDFKTLEKMLRNQYQSTTPTKMEVANKPTIQDHPGKRLEDPPMQDREPDDKTAPSPYPKNKNQVLTFHGDPIIFDNNHHMSSTPSSLILDPLQKDGLNTNLMECIFITNGLEFISCAANKQGQTKPLVAVIQRSIPFKPGDWFPIEDPPHHYTNEPSGKTKSYFSYEVANLVCFGVGKTVLRSKLLQGGGDDASLGTSPRSPDDPVRLPDVTVRAPVHPVRPPDVQPAARPSARLAHSYNFNSNPLVGHFFSTESLIWAFYTCLRSLTPNPTSIRRPNHLFGYLPYLAPYNQRHIRTTWASLKLCIEASFGILGFSTKFQPKPSPTSCPSSPCGYLPYLAPSNQRPIKTTWESLKLCNKASLGPLSLPTKFRFNPQGIRYPNDPFGYLPYLAPWSHYDNPINLSTTLASIQRFLALYGTSNFRHQQPHLPKKHATSSSTSFATYTQVTISGKTSSNVSFHFWPQKDRCSSNSRHNFVQESTTPSPLKTV